MSAEGTWADPCQRKEPEKQPEAAWVDPCQPEKQGELVVLQDAFGIVPLELEVPTSVYGSAAVAGLLMEPGGWGQWFHTCGRQWLCLTVNIAMQTAFIVCVNNIRETAYEDITSGECDELTMAPFLVMLSVSIYAAFVIKDIEESMRLALLFFVMIPTTAKSKVFKYKKSEDGGWELADVGFSCVRKLGIAGFVILPKLGIAVALLVLGAQYLAASASDADLILNSLALIFVLDLDEMIYVFVTPSFNKRLLEHLPPIQEQRVPWYWRLWEQFGVILKTIAIAVCLIFMYTVPMCGYPEGAESNFQQPSGKSSGTSSGSA